MIANYLMQINMTLKDNANKYGVYLN